MTGLDLVANTCRWNSMSFIFDTDGSSCSLDLPLVGSLYQVPSRWYKRR